VSTLCPTPKVLPYSVWDIAEGFFAYYTFVVVRKTPENRIQLFDEDFLFCTIQALNLLTNPFAEGKNLLVGGFD
jgi:hypothetical protein